MKTRAPTLAPLATMTGDLAGLSELEASALAVFIPSDVRPLKGVAGFVDWRIDGALSRCLLRGFFHGLEKEVLLLPVQTRSWRRRFFLFGLGHSKALGRERLHNHCEFALDVLQRAGVSSVVLAAPAGFAESNLEERFVQVASALGPTRIDKLLIAPKSRCTAQAARVEFAGCDRHPT